jgi:hypothetical protein
VQPGAHGIEDYLETNHPSVSLAEEGLPPAGGSLRDPVATASDVGRIALPHPSSLPTSPASV